MATSKAGPGQKLCSVQVMSMAANTSDMYSVSGVDNIIGSSEVRMTPNSVGSTQPYTHTKWHGLVLAVNPGVLNPGQTAPDLAMWMVVDEKLDLKSYFYVDISVPRNMLPHKNVVEGKRFLVLGNSMYKAALTASKGRGLQAFGGNWALEFTGPKAADDITFHFASTAGFTTGPTGTFASPPTIDLIGDVYDADMWNFVVGQMGSWNGNISITSLRRQVLGVGGYAAIHQVPDFNAGFDSDAFLELPDGVKQNGGQKVHRFMRFTTPLLAVSGTDIYPLTNLVQGVGGKPGQVGQNNEFGFKFSKNNNAVQIVEFGRRPVAGSGYFGLTSGTNLRYPYDTNYGVVDTVGAPHVWYGQAQPIRTAPELYYLMGRYGDWGDEPDMEVIAGEDIAFYTSAQNGQTIAAGTEYTAIGGNYIGS